MKTIVLLLMFGVPSLGGLYYGHTLSARENTLKELSGFFKYLVIRISSKGLKLQDAVKSYKAGKYLNGFLNTLLQAIKIGCAYPFETAAYELFALKEEDLSMISSMGMGMLGFDEQIKALENAICYFDEEVKKLKKTDKQRHIVSYSGIFAGLALVVIFI